MSPPKAGSKPARIIRPLRVRRPPNHLFEYVIGWKSLSVAVDKASKESDEQAAEEAAERATNEAAARAAAAARRSRVTKRRHTIAAVESCAGLLAWQPVIVINRMRPNTMAPVTGSKVGPSDDAPAAAIAVEIETLTATSSSTIIAATTTHDNQMAEPMVDVPEVAFEIEIVTSCTPVPESIDDAPAAADAVEVEIVTDTNSSTAMTTTATPDKEITESKDDARNDILDTTTLIGSLISATTTGSTIVATTTTTGSAIADNSSTKCSQSDNAFVTNNTGNHLDIAIPTEELLHHGMILTIRDRNTILYSAVPTIAAMPTHAQRSTALKMMATASTPTPCTYSWAPMINLQPASSASRPLSTSTLLPTAATTRRTTPTLSASMSPLTNLQTPVSPIQPTSSATALVFRPRPRSRISTRSLLMTLPTVSNANAVDVGRRHVRCRRRHSVDAGAIAAANSGVDASADTTANTSTKM